MIPVDYAPQAEAIAKYEAELEKLLKDKQEEITERNLELQEGVFTARQTRARLSCRRQWRRCRRT